MNHKKCEKVREIDEIGGVQPDLARRAATFLSLGISFQVPNQRTRQPRGIPAKGGNRIARSALCGGKLKTLPRWWADREPPARKHWPCRSRPEPPQIIPARSPTQWTETASRPKSPAPTAST